MKLLLDTQVLLWAAADSAQLPSAARGMIEDSDNLLTFSAASLWEIAEKSTLGRVDFRADVRSLRRGLLDNGYVELEITGRHVVAVARLPALHKDPIDRMLIAQATADNMVLLTVDPLIARYPGPVQMF
ncbi:MAG TPA: type II toxin-antitoxin system VapC family toxin [Acidobacteriaceae bacterium]|jgi:PIN domain nuclease of toxin-antitoxin system